MTAHSDDNVAGRETAIVDLNKIILADYRGVQMKWDKVEFYLLSTWNCYVPKPSYVFGIRYWEVRACYCSVVAINVIWNCYASSCCEKKEWKPNNFIYIGNIMLYNCFRFWIKNFFNDIKVNIRTIFLIYLQLSKTLIMHGILNKGYSSYYFHGGSRPPSLAILNDHSVLKIWENAHQDIDQNLSAKGTCRMIRSWMTCFRLLSPLHWRCCASRLSK